MALPDPAGIARMSRQRVITVGNCTKCPYSDHSGRFTVGGAIPLCRGIAGHGNRTESRNRDGSQHHTYPDQFWSVRPMKPGTREYDGTIPDWCPLPSR